MCDSIPFLLFLDYLVLAFIWFYYFTKYSHIIFGVKSNFED